MFNNNSAGPTSQIPQPERTTEMSGNPRRLPLASIVNRLDDVNRVPALNIEGTPARNEFNNNENEVIDQNTVPEQIFSFETNWRSFRSRKGVACLILKLAFPELKPERANLADRRVCNILQACCRAEYEAFSYSINHADYEAKLKEIIVHIVRRKEAFLGMARALAGWRRRYHSAQVMDENNNNDFEGQGQDRPLLALMPPAPDIRGRIASSESRQTSTEPESSPVRRNVEQMRGNDGNYTMRSDDTGEPLFTSTPRPGLPMKRRLEPQNSDQQAANSLGGPPPKKMMSESAAIINNFAADAAGISQSRPPNIIIPAHLMKQEIKTERPTPPPSPMPSASGRPNHNSMQLALMPSTSRASYGSNRRANRRQEQPTYMSLSKIWRSNFLPIINTLMNGNDTKQFNVRTDKDHYVTGYFQNNTLVPKLLDLNTIYNLMADDDYMRNPWNFVTDVCWLFTAPLCSSRKNLLKKQRCAKSALKYFLEEANAIMTKSKYCCGRPYFHFPYDLVCVGREPEVCSVPPYTKYYLYDNTSVVCEKCWNANKTSLVKLRDRNTSTEKFILKSEFTEMKNDKIFIEPMVTCANCYRQFHKICVLYCDLNGCNVYTCDACLAKRGLNRQLRLKAANLPTSMLDQCIENRVSKYLADRQVENKVWIRVVSCVEKITEVRQGMKDLYVNSDSEFKLSESYGYRQKVLFAFEEIDGKEVAFFAMYVQEYGSDCPPPNTKRAYISYLDSVHYFQPKQYRTGVYHEILLGYLQHIKSLGFTTFHIWACPPSEGNDYIFYAHPPEQKVPKAARLLEWYRMMLEKALVEGIIQEYKNMCRQVIDDKLESVVQIPYMDGDFWPETLESTIKIMETEKEKEKSTVVKKAAPRKKKGKAKKPAEIALEKECETILKSDALSDRVMALVRTHKDLFFVAYLNDPSSNQPIVDPDPLTQPCLVDNRDALLDNGREGLYEFSTLRRAIHSTQVLLKECTPGFGDRETYTCNHCNKGIDENIISYTCPKCVDFDLCDSCLLKHSHPHQMQPRGVDIQGDIPETNPDTQDDEAPPQGTTKAVALRRFAHAVQCHDIDCSQLHCHRLKSLYFHLQDCRGALQGCKHCIYVANLAAKHAYVCTIPASDCKVIKCTEVKQFTRLSDPERIAKIRGCSANLADDSTFEKFKENLNSLKLNASVGGQEGQYLSPD